MEGELNAAPACEHCGASDAVYFADQWICRECYEHFGACCANDDEGCDGDES